MRAGDKRVGWCVSSLFQTLWIKRVSEGRAAYAVRVNIDAVPRPLKVTITVVVAQAVALVVLSILQLFNLHDNRLAMSFTSIAFWLLIAGALVVCARALVNLHSWARSPIVLVEFINLGLAWSFREMPVVGVVLFLASAAALIGIFAPVSLHALDPVED